MERKRFIVRMTQRTLKLSRLILESADDGGPCDLRCRSVARRVVGSWVRIQPSAWKFYLVFLCVLSR